MAKDDFSQLGHNTSCISTNSNDVHCPGCYNSSSIEIAGTLHIDGNPLDLKKCNTCMRLFTDNGGDIQKFIQSHSELNDKNVTFTATDNSSPASPNNVNYSNIENEVSQMKSEIINLSNTMQQVVGSINDLIDFNREFIEQQKKNPLSGLRNKIYDFDLE